MNLSKRLASLAIFATLSRPGFALAEALTSSTNDLAKVPQDSFRPFLVAASKKFRIIAKSLSINQRALVEVCEPKGTVEMLTKRDLLGSAAMAAFAATVKSTTVFAQNKSAWPNMFEAKDIAEAGFIYGLPIVMNYAVMHEYAIDRNSGQFKAPFNQIKNEPNVFTYKDTAIVTPNSDTPYS
ncbi:hypothetical protein AB4Z10_26065, partial [Bosea sp. RAF48]